MSVWRRIIDRLFPFEYRAQCGRRMRRDEDECECRYCRGYREGQGDGYCTGVEAMEIYTYAWNKWLAGDKDEKPSHPSEDGPP